MNTATIAAAMTPTPYACQPPFPAITDACLYRMPCGAVLVDFKETGNGGWWTARADTEMRLLTQGYVAMDEPESGDEYWLPYEPGTGPIRQFGILHAPQVAALVLLHHQGNKDYRAGKPQSANEVEVPAPQRAEEIIAAFRTIKFPAAAA